MPDGLGPWPRLLACDAALGLGAVWVMKFQVVHGGEIWAVGGGFYSCKNRFCKTSVSTNALQP